MYGVAFKMIFCMSKIPFEHMMMEIMNRPALKFYQDPCGHQGIKSCSLEGMCLYPLKTLTYGVPYSAFVDYFRISIQFGMTLCRKFYHGIKALYMK